MSLLGAHVKGIIQILLNPLSARCPAAWNAPPASPWHRALAAQSLNPPCWDCPLSPQLPLVDALHAIPRMAPLMTVVGAQTGRGYEPGTESIQDPIDTQDTARMSAQEWKREDG